MNEARLEAKAEELAAELVPMRPFRHPLVRTLPWIAATAVYASVLARVFGIRPDLSVMLHDLPFLFETGLAIMLVCTAALAAAWLTVPDQRGHGWVVVPALTLCTVFLFWIVMRAVAEGFHMPSIVWHACATRALLFGAMPAASIWLLTRAGATVRPFLMVFMAVQAAAAVGWLALRYVCPSEAAGHIFCFHFMPYLVVGGVLATLARKLYHW